MSKAQVIDYKRIILPLIVVCYTSMYVLILIADEYWMKGTERDGIYWQSFIPRLIEYSFLGGLVFLLPYERILRFFNVIKAGIYNLFDVQESKQKFINFFGALLIYGGITYSYYFYLDHLYLCSWKRGIYATYFFLLGVFILAKTSNYITSKFWGTVYGISFVLFSSYMHYLYTDSFIFMSAFAATMIVVWMFISSANHKMNFGVLIGTIISSAYLFLQAIYELNHFSSWDKFLKNKSVHHARDLLMERVSINVSRPFYYGGDYIFTYIYYSLGILGLIGFGVLLLALIVLSIIAIYKLYRASKTRATVALGIVLYFALNIAYCILQELAILPTSWIVLFKLTTIPVLAIGLRMFWIRNMSSSKSYIEDTILKKTLSFIFDISGEDLKDEELDDDIGDNQLVMLNSQGIHGSSVVRCVDILVKNQEFKSIEEMIELIDDEDNEPDKRAAGVKKLLTNHRNNLTSAKTEKRHKEDT